MRTQIKLKHVEEKAGCYVAKYIVYALIGGHWSPVGTGKSFNRFDTREEAEKFAAQVKLAVPAKAEGRA